MISVKPAAKTESSASDEAEADSVTSRAMPFSGMARHIRLVGVLLYAVLVALSSYIGPAMVVLVLAGGALVAVIAIFWASLRLLLGETPLSGADAYALGAPSTEEEQKQAVLRALKDLEFERSVDKISEEDYAELVAKYRTEAKRLLRVLDVDAQPGRDRVAALVAKRLRRAGLADGEDGAAKDEAAADEEAPRAKPAKAKRRKAKSAASSERDDAPAADVEPADAPDHEPAANEATPYTCVACTTTNDPDAAFCKRCGQKREPAAAKEASADGEAEGTSEAAS